MLPLRYSRLSRREGRQRAEYLLERVGLADRFTHRPNELSGGEQQRVALARSLINRPAIVLADEPTGEVDTRTATEIVELLRELNLSEGQTFILVTHDSLVAEATTRTLYLQDGQVVGEERRP
jgi:putative ABC transport system ATP-binding protein